MAEIIFMYIYLIFTWGKVSNYLEEEKGASFAISPAREVKLPEVSPN